MSFAQAMVSRPIVAGPLAGLVLGEPVTGMWVGSVLEILSLRQLPIGAHRGWDTGPAAIVAAAAAVAWGAGPVGILIGVGFGVVVGWLGNWSVHLLRQWNASLVAPQEPVLITPSTLAARHFGAMGLDLLRATLLSGVGVWIAVTLARGLGATAPEPAASVATFVVLAVASMGLGVDVRMMARGRRVWVAFALGAGLAVLVGIWLP